MGEDKWKLEANCFERNSLFFRLTSSNNWKLSFISHAIFFTCNEIRKQICESNSLLAVTLSQVKKRNKTRVEVRAM